VPGNCRENINPEDTPPNPLNTTFSYNSVSFSKHGQVKGYFNRELIKTGIFSVDMGKLYNKVFEYRQKFDYVDFAVPDRDMVSEYIEKAREFHARINEYIQTQ
jgi:hypothetical protein